MPEEKELTFFNKEYYFFRGKMNERDSWEEYLSHFSGGEMCTAVGEATPGYALVKRSRNIPTRIAEALPDVRLIYIVRHPLRRIESAWRQNVLRGRLPPDTFEDALWNYAPIVGGSQYYETLSAYRDCFSDDQILLLFLKDLRDKPQRTLNRCFEFLGVEPIAETLNQGSPKNQSKDNKHLLPIIKKIRGGIAWNLGSSLIPANTKKYFIGLFYRPLPSVDWREETLKWATTQVKEGARKTLDYGGKPSHFWQFHDELSDEYRQ